MRCYVCSLHVVRRCLSVERVLQSMRMSCKNKQHGCQKLMKYHEKHEHEEACIFEPCSCPIADCDFRASYKDFASHFRLTHQLFIQSFKFDQVYRTAVHHDEEMVILQEFSDGTLFVMNNKVESTTNIISLCHITPSALNMEFSVQLVAESQCRKRSCSLDANVRNIQATESSSILSVPYEFFQPSGCIGLEICIQKSDAV